jgi:hypothetical protein
LITEPLLGLIGCHIRRIEGLDSHLEKVYSSYNSQTIQSAGKLIAKP